MATLSTISIKLDAQTAELKKGFQEAANATKGLQGQIQKSLGSGIMKFNAALQAARVGLDAFRFALDAVYDTMARGAEIGDFADRIQISSDALQRLHRVVIQFGASSGILNTSLQRMQRRIADAAMKGGPLADSMEAVGLSVKELSALSPDEQFMRVADAVQAMGNAGQQSAFVMSLMDTEGVALNETLRQGSEALRERMGLVEESTILTEGEIIATQDAQAALDVWSESWKGFKDNIVILVIPALTKLLSLLQKTLPYIEMAIEAYSRLPWYIAPAAALFQKQADAGEKVLKVNEALEVQAKATAEATDKVVKDTEKATKAAKQLSMVRAGGVGAASSTTAAGFSALHENRRRAEDQKRWQNELLTTAEKSLAVSESIRDSLEPLPVSL